MDKNTAKRFWAAGFFGVSLAVTIVLGIILLAAWLIWRMFASQVDFLRDKWKKGELTEEQFKSLKDQLWWHYRRHE